MFTRNAETHAAGGKIDLIDYHCAVLALLFPVDPVARRVSLMPVFGITRFEGLDPLVPGSVAVQNKYNELNGAPGNKVGEIQSIPGTSGFVQHYQYGAIYGRPLKVPCWVRGDIHRRYVELGAGTSYLGLPLTDEQPWTDPDSNKPGRISHFQRGAIAWTSHDQRTVEFPARRVIRSGHIGVSSVGGWCELVLTSAGTFHFRGHLHNSGFVGLYCTVATAVRIPGTDRALAARYEANVGGTTSFDSRDEDWDESGFNEEIRANWNALAGQLQMKTTIEATLGGWEVVTLVLLPAIGAVALVALLSGQPGYDTQCTYTAGSHMVVDSNNRTVVEPDGVRCRRRE